MKVFTLDAERLTGFTNDVIDQYLHTLLKDGIIDKTTLATMEQYRAVVHSHGFFGKILSRNKEQPDDSVGVSIVKLTGVDDDE